MKKKSMKKAAIVLSAVLTLSLAGCGASGKDNANSAAPETEKQSSDNAEADKPSSETQEADGQSEQTEEAASTASVSSTEEKSEGTMTYDEYMAANVDTEVTIEAYVQAKQSWWEDQATIYAQDKDGAYFLYNIACSQEDYDKLIPGTKIKVNGYKAEWSGEIEIIDATFEILEGNYIAEAKDVTNLLGSEELIKHQNQFVSFQGMTVEDSGDGAAYLYKWDGSGTDGDDLYFNVSLNGETYTFTVESYLCDKTTDVYAAVKNLKIGDVVDMEGFLYWYEGVNPHITSVTVK